MIRPLLLSAGSRGDVEPLIAIVDGLSKSSTVEHITLVIPENYAYLVPKSANVTIVGLKFNLEDALKYLPAFSQPENAQELAKEDAGIELKRLAAMVRAFILPNTQRIVEIAENLQPTVVLSTAFTSTISKIIYEKMGIPHIALHLQPTLPSAYYPNIILHPEEAAAALVHLREGRTEQAYGDSNILSHQIGGAALLKSQVEDINAECEKLGMGQFSSTFASEIDMGKAPDTYVFIAVQSQLMPRAPDFPTSSHIVGSLGAAYTPSGWTPETSHAELARFIKEGPRPVAVTYGSMDAQGVASQTTRSLLNGLRNADIQRVVLLPGKAQLGLHHLNKADPKDAKLLAWAKDHVFVTQGNVQYAWLFPQCSMVFCHCGAGTTSAALCAGIPVAGTPLIADQLFFVELLSQSKLGIRVGTTGLASITDIEVERAVRVAISEEVKSKAKAFAEEEKRRNETVAKACQLIEVISK